MEFNFTTEHYQTVAVESVCIGFKGQPYISSRVYRVDRDKRVYDESDYISGHANEKVHLEKDELKKNIRDVQINNNIRVKSLYLDTDTNKYKKDIGKCSLDVEMETGTGKTYVYIKTIYELNKRYGWSKFIIVVPSIAIKEGVKKNFEITQAHFKSLYPNAKENSFFVYDSSKLNELWDYSESADVKVMIITMQAFNRDSTIFNTARDSLESRKPIDVIKANHPIVILDEPQKLSGEKTTKMLGELDPLFTLNYSATHKDRHDLVYKLDPLDAYNQKLVKKITVKGFELTNLQGSNSYVYLHSVEGSKGGLTARLDFEVKLKNSSIKRKTFANCGIDYSLYDASNGLEQYKRFVISDITNESITFANGITIKRGHAIGDVNEKDKKRIQISSTIRAHFEKEKELYPLGIKTLSLFFIDEVARYRKYDENGEALLSEYAEIFEQEYNAILQEYITLDDEKYSSYLKNIPTNKTHAGYFSIDKKGRFKNSKANGDSKDDETAYELILKNKEKLLSFDSDVRFIFSHSALREGWDNPNVFQICTLKDGGDSTDQKRQEVGRGLRLCVNQNGDRMDKHKLGDKIQEINNLTVITSGTYETFVKDLQKNMKEELYNRPTKADVEFFRGRVVLDDKGKEVCIDGKKPEQIHDYFVKNGYVDKNNHLTKKYKSITDPKDYAPMPSDLMDIAMSIHKITQTIFDDSQLDIIENDDKVTKIKNEINEENFKKFEALWNAINDKYSYRVSFDSEKLIEDATKNINDNMRISNNSRYTETTGSQRDNTTREDIEGGNSFKETSKESKEFKPSAVDNYFYDLIKEVADGTNLTRRTVGTILAKIDAKQFAHFQNRPEEFIKEATRLINEAKNTTIVNHITYNKASGKYDRDIFTEGNHFILERAFMLEDNKSPQKSVQKYVFLDGYAKDIFSSVEGKFCKELELSTDVTVYAKLPSGFKIPTPMGDYSPDWAIAFNEGTIKHVYFIAETKGSINEGNLRQDEKSKIKCAERLFKSMSNKNIIYHKVASYGDMLDAMSDSNAI